MGWRHPLCAGGAFDTPSDDGVAGDNAAEGGIPAPAADFGRGSVALLVSPAMVGDVRAIGAPRGAEAAAAVARGVDVDGVTVGAVAMADAAGIVAEGVREAAEALSAPVIALVGWVGAIGTAGGVLLAVTAQTLLAPPAASRR